MSSKTLQERIEKSLMLSKPEAQTMFPGRRTRALIVRHGLSTFNVQQRCQGRSDEPTLTDRGAAAAAQTGLYLTTERADVLISSPLMRARQTAEIIAAILREHGQDHLLLKTSDDLMEIDLPEWEGVALETIHREFPESYRIWKDEPHEFRMSVNIRSAFFPVRDLFEQASRFWRGLLRHHDGQTVALITHGGTARALICTAVGLESKRFHSLQQSNCGVSTLEFPAGSITAKIEVLNSTAHLGEHLPKLKQGRQGTRILMIAGDTLRHASTTTALLDALPIDFALSADDLQSREMAHALILAHPRAQLSVFPGRILFDTQHPEILALAEMLAPCPNTLSTGVFVGRSCELDAWLCAVLEIDGKRLPWKQASNAILHYPAAGKRPVVQAFNMPLCKETPELVEVCP
jgi:probable phosphoglycerate mutase